MRPTQSLVQIAVSFTLVVSGAGGILCAGAVRAGQPRQPEVDGYRRFGPLFYTPILNVRSFGYDDNVFLDAGGAQSDLTATVGPEVKGVLGLGRRGWAVLHGAVDFTGYAKLHALDHFDNQHGLGLTFWLADLRLSAAYDRGRVLRRPSSEVDHRVRRDQSMVRMAALYEVTSATALEARLVRLEEQYDQLGGIDYDRTLGHTDSILELEGRHRVGPFSWAVLSVSGGTQDGHAAQGVRDLRRGQLLIGLDLEPGALLQGSVRLGASSMRTTGLAADRRQDAEGATGRGDLELKVSSRSRAGLRFYRDFTPSTYLDNLYFRNDMLEVSWVREMTARTAAEVGAGRGRIVYPDPQPERRIDRIDEVFLGARVRLKHDAVLKIRISQWSRDSNVPGQDRDRLVIDQSVSIPL